MLLEKDLKYILQALIQLLAKAFVKIYIAMGS